MEQPLQGVPLIVYSIDEVIRDLEARGAPGHEEQVAILTKLRTHLVDQATDKRR